MWFGIFSYFMVFYIRHIYITRNVFGCIVHYDDYIAEYNRCLLELNEINAIQQFHLTETMTKLDMENDCTICVDKIKQGDKMIKLDCEHYYHKKCILNWFRQHMNCPICRYAPLIHQPIQV